MIKNYFTISIRNILKNKNYSLIIIAGLTLGIATSLFLYNYVSFEVSYDNFHEQGEKLYRVNVKNKEGFEAYKSAYSYAPQGPMAKKEIPEILDFVRLCYDQPIVISNTGSDHADQSFNVIDYYYADSGFFDLFSFPLLMGDEKTVLKQTDAIAISESIAKKVFGEKNPIGQSLVVDGETPRVVTGVFKDVPKNTHLKFNLIMPLASLSWKEDDNWGNHSFFTYYLLKDNADVKNIEKKVNNAYIPHTAMSEESVWELQNISEAYLYTGNFTSTPEFFKFGNERHVKFLILIALVILVIAWINYINLFTAKSSERLKEIGVRKTSGAGKKHIILQFISETLIYNLISIVLALCIIFVFQNVLKEMDFTENIAISNANYFWSIVIFIFVIGSLISGGYPALMLGALNPKQIINSTTKATGSFSARSALVVLQFVIVLALISFTAHVNKQLRFMQNIDLGFEKEQVLVINAPRLDFDENRVGKLNVFRNEVTKHAGIQDVCASQTIPGQRFGYGNSIFRIDKEIDRSYSRVGYISPNFIDFYNIELLAGRSFKFDDNPNSRYLVINESEAKQLEFEKPEDAINQKVRWNNRTFTIIGVIKDFHQESLHKMHEPTVYHQYVSNCNYLCVKLSGQNFRANVDNIEDSYQAAFPGNPFDFFFLDNHFNAQYFKDVQFQKLFTFFSILAIAIGYLGLFGLMTFVVINRTKEIGIRKVNGAKVSEVLSLFNTDYLKWILISVTISIPLAWTLILRWLENFAYKIEVDILIFGVTGLTIVILALITISAQSWKVASGNPVEALRYE